MGKLATHIAWAGLTLCVARAASPCPERYGPFEESEKVRAFPVHRCATVERKDSHTEAGFPIRTLARNDGARRNACVRVEPADPSRGTMMTVLGPDGHITAGPVQISSFLHAGRAFWADLNGDGLEDFVQFVRSLGCGLAGVRGDLGIALSSEQGYSIVAVRTMAPRLTDFIDLGDGRPRLVQTSFVYGRSERGRDGKPHNYWVHNLLEFEGDRVVTSEADPRFPMWVWYTFKPSHKETSIITPEQKKRLWAEVPDRIFGRPPPSRAPVGARETALAD